MPDKTKTKNNICVFFLFTSFFWLSNSGRDTSEGEFHYEIAKVFVEKGCISFENQIEGIFTKAPNGRYYGSHEFGNILPLIPTAAFNHLCGLFLNNLGVQYELILRAQQFVVSLQAAVYESLTLVFLFMILREEYGQKVLQALIGVSLVAFCTFFWTYSRNLFDGVLCGFLLIAATRFLLKYRKSGHLSDVFFAFGLLGYGVDTRLSMALAVIASFFFLISLQKVKFNAFLVACASLAPFAIWQIYYNNLRTGNPFTSPVQTTQYAANNALDGDLLIGLQGLLASPGKSLFVYAPILLLSVFGFRWYFQQDKKMGIFVALLGCLWLLLHAKLRSWYGAWGWGPRHFVSMVPFLAIPGLVALPNLWTNKIWKCLVITSGFCGFILAFSSIIGNWHYRMGLAFQEGRLDNSVFVWSALGNQAFDMIKGSVINFRVLAGQRDSLILEGASELNIYASNRVNVWWYIMPHFGIPISFVLFAALILMATVTLSLNNLIRSGRHD
jgi:hypothetical protein